MKNKQIYTTNDFTKMLPSDSDNALNVAFDTSDNQYKGMDSNGVIHVLGAGTGLMKVVSKTLTIDEVKALGTTPVVLLDAIAGKSISPVSLNRTLNYGTVDYAEDNTLRVGYAGIMASKVHFSKSNNFLNASEGVSQQILRKEGLMESSFLDKSIEITANNDATLGDSTITFTMTYYAIDLA